jgi:hypothetical protein
MGSYFEPLGRTLWLKRTAEEWRRANCCLELGTKLQRKGKLLTGDCEIRQWVPTTVTEVYGTIENKLDCCKCDKNLGFAAGSPRHSVSSAPRAVVTVLLLHWTLQMEAVCVPWPQRTVNVTNRVTRRTSACCLEIRLATRGTPDMSAVRESFKTLHLCCPFRMKEKVLVIRWNVQVQLISVQALKL